MKHREHKDSTKCHPGVLEDRLVPERSEDDANLLENIFKAYICTLANSHFCRLHTSVALLQLHFPIGAFAPIKLKFGK